MLFTRDPPKTRSAKIMRRVICATYLGREPSNLSSLENPAAIAMIAKGKPFDRCAGPAKTLARVANQRGESRKGRT